LGRRGILLLYPLAWERGRTRSVRGEGKKGIQDTFIFWSGGDPVQQILLFAQEVVPAVKARLGVAAQSWYGNVIINPSGDCWVF
jgi:hypothetical protein